MASSPESPAPAVATLSGLPATLRAGTERFLFPRRKATGAGLMGGAQAVSVANVAPPLPRLPSVAPMRKAGLPVCRLRLQVFTATRTPQTGLIVTLKGSLRVARAPLCRASCFRRARQPLRDAAPVLSIKPGNTPHPEAGTRRASLRGHVPRQPHLAARDGARGWIEQPGTIEAR